MQSTPKVSFTFPIRWLKDQERKYLLKNLVRQIRGNVSSIPMHERLVTGLPSVYSILMRVHAYQPVRVNLKKEELEELLKDVYPGAKMVGFEKFFVQRTNSSLLPVIEMQIFY